MDVFKLYDQFTSNWGRVRTNLTSHFIALGLLWLVGFAPPMPAIGLSTLYAVPATALPPVLQGVGVLALASIAIALLIGAYGIILAEAGYFLDRMLSFIFPIHGPSTRRPRIPSGALWTFAATLEPGPCEAAALQVRISELQSIHAPALNKQLRSGNGHYGSLSRDGTTHYRNAAVFLVAWCILASAFEGQPLGEAVDAVFWRGFIVLAGYFLIVRARLKAALWQTNWFFYNALSELVEADEAYAARLAGARRNREPYDRLVDAFEDLQERRSGPVLADFARQRLALLREGETKESTPMLSEWRRFGSDEKASRDYDDPKWLPNYAKWRVALLADRARAVFRLLLINLGSQPR